MRGHALDSAKVLVRINSSEDMMLADAEAAVEQEAKKWPEVLRLMTRPGVGPLTALAFVLIIGTPKEHRQGGHVPKYKGQQKRWPSQIIMPLRI